MHRCDGWREWKNHQLLTGANPLNEKRGVSRVIYVQCRVYTIFLYIYKWSNGFTEGGRGLTTTTIAVICELYCSQTDPPLFLLSFLTNPLPVVALFNPSIHWIFRNGRQSASISVPGRRRAPQRSHGLSSNLLHPFSRWLHRPVERAVLYLRSIQ